MIELLISFLFSIGVLQTDADLKNTQVIQEADGMYGVVSIDEAGNKIHSTYVFDEEISTFREL